MLSQVYSGLHELLLKLGKADEGSCFAYKTVHLRLLASLGSLAMLLANGLGRRKNYDPLGVPGVAFILRSSKFFQELRRTGAERRMAEPTPLYSGAGVTTNRGFES